MDTTTVTIFVGLIVGALVVLPAQTILMPIMKFVGALILVIVFGASVPMTILAGALVGSGVVNLGFLARADRTYF
jgi:hypothetical protein